MCCLVFTCGSINYRNYNWQGPLTHLLQLSYLNSTLPRKGVNKIINFSSPFLRDMAWLEGLIEIWLLLIKPCYRCNWFYKYSLYKFLVEPQLMQIPLLIKFQSVSLCNFKTFSTNYILITIKIFLDLSFSASKMSGIVSGLIFKVKHNFPGCQQISIWISYFESFLSVILIADYNINFIIVFNYHPCFYK